MNDENHTQNKESVLVFFPFNFDKTANHRTLKCRRDGKLLPLVSLQLGYN